MGIIIILCITQVVYGNMVVRNNYEEATESYTTSYLSIYPQSPDVGTTTISSVDVIL